MELETLIRGLEIQAAESLVNKMRPFGSDGITCPWLQWRLKYIGDKAKVPHGLFLMQDWGNQDQSLEEATNDIISALKQTKDGDPDRTLINLLSKPDWNAAILNGDWMVCNAVWGLRNKGTKKCGFLADAIHKAAFPIWLDLLSKLSENNPNFTLVVAGKWAVFDNEFDKDNSMILKDYLDKWVHWGAALYGSKKMFECLKKKVAMASGTVVYVDHPAIWNRKTLPDWRHGPPQ